MRKFLAAIIASSAAAALTAVSAAGRTASAAACPKPVAHQGLHWPYTAPPENSTGALWTAHAAGVNSVETDIRFSTPTSRDPGGVPFIMHDPTVNRMTNWTGYAMNYAPGTLAGMHLVQQSWKTDVTGYTVPSLYTYLYDAKKWGVRVNVEIKASYITWGQAVTFARRFEWLGDWNSILVSSFYAQPLHEIRYVDSRFTGRELLYVDAPVYSPGTAWEGIAYTTVTAVAVARLHGEGVKADAWTANDPRAWPGLAADGVDSITSDNAAPLRLWEAAHC